MTIGLPGETKWGAAWLTAMEPGVEVTMTELVGELMVTMGFGRLNLMGPNCSSVASQMPSMGGSHAANMELALSSGISEALSTKSIPLAEKQFSMSTSLACMCTLVLVRLTFLEELSNGCRVDRRHLVCGLVGDAAERAHSTSGNS